MRRITPFFTDFELEVYQLWQEGLSTLQIATRLRARDPNRTARQQEADIYNALSSAKDKVYECERAQRVAA